MSSENIEVVVGLIKAWMTGDRSAARAAWDRDAVMILPGHRLRGRRWSVCQSIERAVESWRKSWGAWRFEVDEVIDAGEQVIVIGHQRAEGKESGAEVELLSCGVWGLRNSKVVRAEFFGSRAEALRAGWGVEEVALRAKSATSHGMRPKPPRCSGRCRSRT